MVVKAADVWNWDSPKETIRRDYSGEQSSRCLAGGDKDGGHTIRSAIAENPLLYANITALSSIESEFIADFTLCE